MAGTYHLFDNSLQRQGTLHQNRERTENVNFLYKCDTIAELQRVKALSTSYIDLTPNDGGNTSLVWLENSLQRQGTLHQNRERTENVNFSCKCDTIGRVAENE